MSQVQKPLLWRVLILFLLLIILPSLAREAKAADQVEMVLLELRSTKGLLGNDVCRFRIKLKNGTAERIEKLEFSLVFPRLSAPAKGGTGLQFFSPESVGSDSEAEFIATWHDGGCADAHYESPKLVVDVCVIGRLSERDCKSLFTVRSEIRRPAAPARSTQQNIPAVPPQPLTELALRGVDCQKLHDPNRDVDLLMNQYYGLPEPAANAKPMKIFQLAFARGQDEGAFRLDDDVLSLKLVNGFETVVRNPRDTGPYRLERSIDIRDGSFLKTGRYSYDLEQHTPRGTYETHVSRQVTDLGEQNIAGCRFNVVAVKEEWGSPSESYHQITDYFWYPELKMRIDVRIYRTRRRPFGNGMDIWVRYYKVYGLSFR